MRYLPQLAYFRMLLFLPGIENKKQKGTINLGHLANFSESNNVSLTRNIRFIQIRPGLPKHAKITSHKDQRIFFKADTKTEKKKTFKNLHIKSELLVAYKGAVFLINE